MNIHEYQAKELLAKFGVPVPAGYAAHERRGSGRRRRRSFPGRSTWSRRRSTPAAAARASSRSSAPTPRAACGWRSRSTRSAPTRARCSATRWSPSRPAPRASRSTGSTSPTASTSPRNTTSRCWSTAKSGRIAMVVSTEGGMNIEDVAHDTPEKITTHHHRSGDRLHAASRPRGRLRARARRAISPSRRRSSPAQLYDAFVGTDCLDDRDQPAGRDRRRRAAGARRQDELRFERDVPPPRRRGAARRERGGPDGGRGVEVRPRLHQARRQHRLHGQRRRPRHGDDGHHQARTARSRPTSSTSAAAPRRRR